MGGGGGVVAIMDLDVTNFAQKRSLEFHFKFFFVITIRSGTRCLAKSLLKISMCIKQILTACFPLKHTFE